MLTDLDLVLACEATYGGAPPTWQNADKTVHVFLSQIKGVWVVAFEGTTDLAEWAIDFEAIPVDERGYRHETLGWVHKGWYDDVASVQAPILAKLHELQASGGALACTGHSKGASEALIFAALAKTDGINWARVSTFGTPHPGDLNGLITGALGRDYQNRSDPVCDVPWYLGRPRPITHIAAPLPEYNTPDWAFLVDHHIQNYVSAIRAKEQAS